MPLNSVRHAWQKLPARVRSTATTVIKVVITVAAFYLLLTHEVKVESGQHVMAFRAILNYLPQINARIFWTFVAIATLLKVIGIVASMYRWHLLLIGQGVRFPFRHLAGSFMVGRFIGTFLPSTIGLDGYKLYDAARFSGRTAGASAATVVEKILGLAGIFLTFLITFPLGYQILGGHAGWVALLTIPMALAIVGVVMALILRPSILTWITLRLPFARHPRLEGPVQKITRAASAYGGQARLILVAAALSFIVHFCTASLYYFTALAIGVMHANFWEVTFASTIQVFATVISPFTIAGEGVREIVQTLLLAHRIGTSQSIISAALGFWAAEAPTLVGGFIYLLRPSDYRPAFVEVTEVGHDDDTEAEVTVIEKRRAAQ